METKVEKIAYRSRSIEKRANKYRVYVGSKITCNSLQEAQAVIDNYMVQLGLVAKVKIGITRETLEDAFARFIEAKKSDGRRGDTIRNYNQLLLTFKKYNPIQYVDEINEQLWHSWSNGDLKECKQVTKWQMFVQLRGFVRWCKSKHIHTSEDFCKMKISTGKAEMEGKRKATADEVQKLLSHAKTKRDEIYMAVLLAASFGVRPREIVRLKKEDYNESDKTLTIRAAVAKTKKKRCFVVSDELAFYFSQAKAKNPNDSLLNSSKRKPWSPEGLGTMMQRLGKEVGLPQLSLYSLRKYAANVIADNGDIRTAYQVLGHSAEVHDHYYSPSDQQLKHIAASVSDRLAGSSSRERFGYWQGDKWIEFGSLRELRRWYNAFCQPPKEAEAQQHQEPMSAGA